MAKLPNYYKVSVDGLTVKLDPIYEEMAEVVRCKDCKHSIWDEDEGLWKCVYDAEFDERYGEYFGFTEYNDGLHFYSYGERRDGE